ncbi:CmcJ/NvfI family oxidoreductase [Aurantiacibacter gilvus]|uniref:CmcJ/NvfI family oxidoreductase n=1 Tax=Aurantiacibacter gilvus TaxID=3139141 RepID=A0ABU9IDK1_9SPHN
MATLADESIEDQARQVRAMMRYVDEGDFVTRRYVSQGEELNTGTYADHEVVIRDGMPIRDHFELDVHGFRIGKSDSAIVDFHDRNSIERLYEREVEADVLRWTGADKCAARGWMLRTSADLSEHASNKSEGYQHRGGLQPPAGEAHVDTAPRTAQRMAEQTYAQCFPDGPGFKRFLITSHWRTFSPPPQDVPLALCDGRTSFGGQEKENTLLIVDEFPRGDALTAPVPGEEDLLAATIFSYHPSHRWWYFAGMERDDVLLFKFFDSDHERTWRCPHSAFVDASAAAPNPRESIECRSVAFWE